MTFVLLVLWTSDSWGRFCWAQQPSVPHTELFLNYFVIIAIPFLILILTLLYLKNKIKIKIDYGIICGTGRWLVKQLWMDTDLNNKI